MSIVVLTLNDRNKWQLSSSLIQGVNCSDQGDKMCVDEMSQNTVQGGLSSRFGGQSQGRVQGGWSCKLWKKWPEGSLKDVDRTWLSREECGGRGGRLTQYFPSLAIWQDHPGERLQNTKVWPHSIPSHPGALGWGLGKLLRWLWWDTRVENHFLILYSEMIDLLHKTSLFHFSI